MYDDRSHRILETEAGEAVDLNKSFCIISLSENESDWRNTTTDSLFLQLLFRSRLQAPATIIHFDQVDHKPM